MELSKLLEAGLALVLVLCLIGIVSILAKKLNEKKFAGFKVSDKRMKLKEVLPIDTKNRFLIIEKDDAEYFISVSNEKIEVIDKQAKKTIDE